MFTRNKLTIAILSACLVPSYAFATDLAPVEVTATAENAQEVSTDTSELLQSGNSETGTTLRQISGVDASRMGGHGVDLVIRGQQASQLNVLIDGAKIEGGCPNRMDPPTAYAEMSSFDEVTVVKGVNSVTYGSGGTGGTVLFERNAPTFEEGKPYNGEINMGTTSNGVTQDINATVSAGGDKGYIVLQGAKKSADSYKDGNNNTVNSSYDSQQGHIDLGWTPNENHELRLSHENTLVEDALFAGAAMDSPKSDGTTTSLRYKGQNISENIEAIEADIYSSNIDHVMDNFTLRDNSGTKSINTTDVQTTGAKVKATSMIGHTQLDYGVQFEGIDKMSTLTNGTSGAELWYMWPDVKTETKSVFAESTSFFRDNQKVIIGLRYDNYSTSTNSATVPTTKGTAISQYNKYSDINLTNDASSDQSNINGLLRYERKLDSGINLYSGLSRTHRYPDATELYIAKGGTVSKNGTTSDVSWIGNPDLKPEQHNQFDIGVSKNTNSFTWTASAFYDKVNDFVLKDTNPNKNQPGLVTSTLMGTATVDKRTVYTNKDATIYGLEVTADWKTSQAIQVGTALSLSKGTNDTDNRNLSNIAPLSGNLYASYQKSDWDTGARLNFATDQTEVNSEFGELETAGWSTLDLYGNYQINKSLKLSAGVDNLFDHAYQTYLNRTDIINGGTYQVYEPGRVVWAKLNAKF